MRPLIAIPARFSATAAALRFGAEVNARALIEAVYRAGGEPFSMHPADDGEAAARLARCDGLLLPGGGDLAPHHYGVADIHESSYDVDEEQDLFDLALARHAIGSGLPVLAICRGLHVVNTVFGGTLHQDMGGHRHVIHPATVEPGTLLSGITRSDKLPISCYHHQCVERPGAGLAVSARAADGTIEAMEAARGRLVAVQWHPEDLAATDPAHQAIFDALVAAAKRS
ncbi:gamma-glutamyl-gamma-aminobutyrate hydrolase family protein [Nonomuraea sp. NPDC049480]|uniref:gamma-glutamyl-gamma-aminobutyrate hydrolase family protein n=1 Tax=Nonomuraea sp. NPDC049480 TaxID=3364353 RepID=UPI0037A7355C